MMLEQIKYTLENKDSWLKLSTDKSFESIGDGWPAYKKILDSNHLKNRRMAIQAGGYCGIFPYCLSLMFDAVYTFEPDVYNFICLMNNTYERSNVFRYQAALGYERGMMAMYYMNEENAGMKKSVSHSQGRIPTLRIDDLQLSHCDLIMLDTEGYEYEALKGATWTISEHRPMISVEDTSLQIEDHLKLYGYKKLADVYRDTFYVAE